MTIGPIQLIRQASPGQRRTLLAAALGWALDAFDAMLYALVLALLMRDLGMSKTTAGLLGTLTLLASGMGGILFGFLADRIGRKRALMASIVTYSVCSFASGLATSIAMLANRYGIAETNPMVKFDRPCVFRICGNQMPTP